MATSFLRFCRSSGDGVAFMVGALGVDCASGVGKNVHLVSRGG